MASFWGLDKHGNEVFTHNLKGNQGMEVCISNYGAIIKNLRIPTRNACAIDTVLHYPQLSQYLDDQHWIGAVCGRYCNRIQHAKFNLNGTAYALDVNENPHHLHGGEEGFSKRTWTIESTSEKHIALSLVSVHGDQGYPGKLNVTVEYRLQENDQEQQLIFIWSATSTHDTVVNLTNHAYFNLAGSGDIAEHHLRIPCQYYTPVNSDGIPLGDILPVENTALDFTQSRVLKDVIMQHKGLDNNWLHAPDEVSNSTGKNTLKHFAELAHPRSGLSLNVHSTLPGLQCYTGNHLAGSKVFRNHQGICLESQFFPDSPNNTNFPSAFLQKDTLTKHETHYIFEQS